MYAPAPDDESTTLVGYVDQQLEALRASVHGLTEEQARSTPCRSALSLAGLLKHVTRGMEGAVALLAGEERVLDAEAYAAYQAAFSLTDDESAAGVLEAFDAARPRYLAALRAADPDAERLEPPSPWHGITEPMPARTRYYLTHQVEEMARHAGHADILREQVDGEAVPRLVLSRLGAPANAFFQPYVAAPGTLDA
ncbi:DinB family protein [Phycicoccus avicenniae]|uniref:DinB family protein n=1 Tax=Phycicoccus avicenniae TaxID=2828860 RepID=UPI003D2CC52B